jgi:tripartite-type tricarboxylate transporter receptor subunit TctC
MTRIERLFPFPIFGLRTTVIAAAAAAIFFVADGARTQTNYPNKPIRIVVGFTAGGPADITTRIIGNRLSGILRQPVIVENRAGAGGVVATEFVARAQPDGYTLRRLSTLSTRRLPRILHLGLAII